MERRGSSGLAGTSGSHGPPEAVRPHFLHHIPAHLLATHPYIDSVELYDYSKGGNGHTGPSKSAWAAGGSEAASEAWGATSESNGTAEEF